MNQNNTRLVYLPGKLSCTLGAATSTPLSPHWRGHGPIRQICWFQTACGEMVLEHVLRSAVNNLSLEPTKLVCTIKLTTRRQSLKQLHQLLRYIFKDKWRRLELQPNIRA